MLTDAANAPRNGARQQLEARWVATAPHAIFGAIFAVIGLLSLLAWLGERERWELWWFGLVCLAKAFAGFNLVSSLLGDIRPFNGVGVAWEFVFGHLDIPLLGEFAFAALGIRSWLARAAMWLAWCAAPLSLLTAALLPNRFELKTPEGSVSRLTWGCRS